MPRSTLRALTGTFMFMLLILSQVHAGTVLYSALKEGIGIRGLSMGGALTALATGPESVFYNPAGLLEPNGFYRYEAYDNNKTLYPEFSAYMVALGPFGLTQVKKQDKAGNAVEITSYSYARRGNRSVDWGVTLKSVTSGTTQGWTGDVGILTHFSPNLQFGALAQDVYKSGVDIPTTARVGLALTNESKEFLIASDLVYEPNDGVGAYGLTPHFGMEYLVSDGFTLRAGWTTNHVSYGGRFSIAIINLDVGVVTSDTDTLYMLGFAIGGSAAPPRYAANTN